MSVTDDIVRYLTDKGWHKSEVMYAMVSPEGSIVPLDSLHNMADHLMKPGVLVHARGVTHAPGGPAAELVKPLFPGKWSPHNRLKARLNLPPGEDFGLDYCAIFEGPNTTFVMVVKGDKALILDDPKDLFPSDSMVARFRLFQEIE